jgi:hypothetical protein
MNRASQLLSVACILAFGTMAVAQQAGKPAVKLSSTRGAMPTSGLFDPLDKQPDVVYLIANSSLVFGVDPHGRSEEVTFIGPVTVPKWPMEGYARRVLPDGRQQIDIELTQSELIGQSYMLHGPVVLAEHPDLRSLGTITERPRSQAQVSQAVHSGRPGEGVTPASAADDAPADFVVERKVLLTTSKGIMYNETAVPVRGRIDSIPPVKFQGTPVGVNVFRGMELPTPLLDQDGNVSGWFYSKAHMAYAVLPKAVARTTLKGSIEIKVDGQVETVSLDGPGEIHHLSEPAEGKSNIEVVMLALRGQSKLLGGDIMITETFGDRDHFSRGELNAQGSKSKAQLELFIDLVTPATKVMTRTPLRMVGEIADHNKVIGRIESGKLNLPLVGSSGRFLSAERQTLYDEVERPTLDVIKMELNLSGV